MSVEEFQEGTRPSLLVVAVQWEVVAWEGKTSFSLTEMEAPGLPVTVSRTWQVIGGFFSGVDIFVVEVVGGEMWFVRAEMRCVVDMRL